MANEDFYQILGVDSEADADKIKKAYDNKVWILHPDRMHGAPESAQRQAEEDLKKVNAAYDVLKDPQKRKEYHDDWLRREGKGATPGTSNDILKPKPVVKPEVIDFKNVSLEETRRATFLITNEGGPYTEIWIDDPGARGSWIRVADYYSTTSSELPMEIVIEARAEEWGEYYSEQIAVRLDDIETHVRIELNTKPEPAGADVGVGGIPTYMPPPPSPVIHRRGMPTWGKWVLGITFIGIIIVLIAGFGSQLWTKNGNSETVSNNHPITSSPTPNTQYEDKPIASIYIWYESNYWSISRGAEYLINHELWAYSDFKVYIYTLSFAEGHPTVSYEYFTYDNINTEYVTHGSGDCKDGGMVSLWITVGRGKDFPTNGREACTLYVRCQDDRGAWSDWTTAVYNVAF